MIRIIKSDRVNLVKSCEICAALVDPALCCCSGKCVGEALGGLKGEKTLASSCTHMVWLGPFVLILGVLGYK